MPNVYPCAGCGKGIPIRHKAGIRRIAGANRYIHSDCRVDCRLCGEDAEDGRRAAVYLNKVVHEECKVADLAAKRESAKVTTLEDDTTRFVERIGGTGFYTRSTPRD